MTKEQPFSKILLITAVLTALFACRAAWHIWRPHYLGRTMPQWLELLRTNNKHDNNTMEIISINDDQGSQMFSCELPMSYDLVRQFGLLTNAGFVLSVNGSGKSTSVFRAADGNVLLLCPIADLSFGSNYLQPRLYMSNQGHWGLMRAFGAIADFVSTNICVINPQDPTAGPDPWGGFDLDADLLSNDANYKIELLGTNEHHLKTIFGGTTDGKIRERWNFANDAGSSFSNNEFEAIYHVAISNYPAVDITQYYRITPQR